MATKDQVLVLTVGTGNWQHLDETLFRPMEKSLKKGEWSKIILLPSTKTEENAIQFQNRMLEYAIEIRPLPEVDQENNSDSCFNHFDKVLNELRQDHCRTKIMIDFTRGTKAMSAAMVLAAVRHQLPRLRYITGRRDERGMVIPGHESISEITTTKVTLRLKIDEARTLMEKHAFSAALELLPEVKNSKLSEALVPQEFQSEISRLRRFAKFWTAWDRLDYTKAVTCSHDFTALEREKLSNEIKYIKILNNEPQEEGHNQNFHADMAKWLLYVALDLLENGSRRIKQQQFEDAFLRAYRVVEMIGQIRLFEKNYNSACIDPDDNNVKAFREHNKKSADFGSIKRGGVEKLTAPRFITARFLKYLGDPLGQQLIKFNEKNETNVSANNRNHSILIHGFSATAGDAQKLKGLYEQIRKLLVQHYPEIANTFKPERFGYFS